MNIKNTSAANDASLQEMYNELAYYTLSYKGDGFIHQHIVDAFTAQTATEDTQPISIFFALAGLYLFVNKNYNGKDVQKAHALMARKQKVYEKIPLPEYRGNITVADVLNAASDDQRMALIKTWCTSVWNAYARHQEKIIGLTESLLR